MSDAHLDPHLQEDHHAPERTTPQGTQAQGVEFGHEGRDVIFAPLFWWFGGLAVFVGLTLILMNATMGMWNPEDRENALPSPLFARQRPIPAPRILPNPVDSGQNPMENLQEYPESLPQEREAEAKKAADLGLFDPKTNEPRVPDSMVSRLAARYGTTAAAPGGAASGGAGANGRHVTEVMPSDPSGGTRDEDRLR